MNKKAALELSITAIVVLIIAITVLGLGIGFIKKQFGAGTELVQAQFAEIKQQLKEQMTKSGELLVFSFPEQATIGKTHPVQIGVLNTAANPRFQDDPRKDSVCYRVEVVCITPFAPNAECIIGEGINVAVGGYDSISLDPVSSRNRWFKRILGQFDLNNYDGDVFDAILLVKGIRPDSYRMEINVYKNPTNEDCSEPGFEPEQAAYASKTFILDVI